MSRTRRRSERGRIGSIIVWQNGIVQVFDISGNPLPRRGGRIEVVGSALKHELPISRWHWRIWPGGTGRYTCWIIGRAGEIATLGVPYSIAYELAEDERAAGCLLYEPMGV